MVIYHLNYNDGKEYNFTVRKHKRFEDALQDLYKLECEIAETTFEDFKDKLIHDEYDKIWYYDIRSYYIKEVKTKTKTKTNSKKNVYIVAPDIKNVIDEVRVFTTIEKAE